MGLPQEPAGIDPELVRSGDELTAVQQRQPGQVGHGPDRSRVQPGLPEPRPVERRASRRPANQELQPPVLVTGNRLLIRMVQ